jgi:hypothetical protein
MLGEFQRTFLAAVLQPGSTAHEQPGMRVYANNVHGQLLAALCDTYEKTRRWLGEEAFQQHAASYIARHRSTSWTLDDYGDAFADHLSAACAETPEVGELAWIDLRLRRAFSGTDAAGVRLEALDIEDWERVELVFVPTLSVRLLHTNAPALWAGLAAGTVPRPQMALPGSGVRVWRQGWEPRFQSIGHEEYACLDLALAGASFGEMCTWLSSAVGPDRVAATAGSLLHAWTNDGLVAAIREPR